MFAIPAELCRPADAVARGAIESQNPTFDAICSTIVWSPLFVSEAHMISGRIVVALTGLFLATFSEPAQAADPSGIWMMMGQGMKVKISPCGEQVCAVIVWLKAPKDENGNARLDAKNSDPALRTRPLIGTSIFGNMRPTEENGWSGDVYNPFDGATYSGVALTMVSADQMKLKACKLLVMCGEFNLKRTTLDAKTPASGGEGKKPSD